MEDLKQTKTKAKNKKNPSSTKKTQSRTLTEDGEEKQVVEIGLYAHVDLLNYWGKWKPQFIVVDKHEIGWVICEHWYSTNNHNEKFSQLGSPLIVESERLRISAEKSNRPLPWDWYKSAEDFIKFCKSTVSGLEQPRLLAESEKRAYQ